jgi:hypothetical protein
VLGPGQPAADPPRHLGVAQPLADHLLGQEVRADEVGEVAAEGVLAGRDDRGVRDRQRQRVPEQRGHREPVGQAADHAGFRGGLDVADPAVAAGAAGQHVDDRGEQQQRAGAHLHPDKTPPADPVGRAQQARRPAAAGRCAHQDMA